MTNVEKIAKLMGYEVGTPEPDTLATELYHTEGSAWIKNWGGRWVWWNPYTNKANNVDVRDELGIDVNWFSKLVMATISKNDDYLEARAEYDNHPTRQAAAMQAVCDVAVMIFDKTMGGGE